MTPATPDDDRSDLTAAREIFVGLVSAYITTDAETVASSNAAVSRYLDEQDTPARRYALISAAAIMSAALLTQLATHTGVSTETLIAGAAGLDLDLDLG